MPELPEVKSYCFLLQNSILKKNILRVKVFTKELRYKVPNNLHKEIFQKKKLNGYLLEASS